MIIVDTGFWLALIDHQDRYHQKAVNAMDFYQKETLITTCSVVTETSYLLFRRIHIEASISFLKSYEKGLFQVFQLKPSHTERIIELMIKYSTLPMDLADASLVILAEHLGHGRILSTDQRDFGIYRWKNTYPFQNLLD